MLTHRHRLLFGVSRIKTSFLDDWGNHETVIGTGFWLQLSTGKTCFVTNGHIIDAELGNPPRLKCALKDASIELRLITETSNDLTFHKDTEFFSLSDESKLFRVDNADCAIILPAFEKELGYFRPYAPFEESDLADEDHFKTKLHVAHDAYFIGFPARSSRHSPTGKARIWWDTLWNMPVARSASIASFPVHPFTNDSEADFIRTQDTLLVSGLSFSGSSGSPIIAKEWGVRVKPPLSCENYVPEKLIGIMSGHWWEEKDQEHPLRHSGLSYLTRSTSILHLIRSNQL